MFGWNEIIVRSEIRRSARASVFSVCKLSISSGIGSFQRRVHGFERYIAEIARRFFFSFAIMTYFLCTEAHGLQSLGWRQCRPRAERLPDLRIMSVLCLPELAAGLSHHRLVEKITLCRVLCSFYPFFWRTCHVC